MSHPDTFGVQAALAKLTRTQRLLAHCVALGIKTSSLNRLRFFARLKATSSEVKGFARSRGLVAPWRFQQ